MKRLLILMVMLSPALDGLAQGVSPLGTDRRGWYAGGGLTYSVVTDRQDDYTEDSSDAAAGLSVYGGYRLNDYVAFELGYINGGELEYSNALYNPRSKLEADISVQATHASLLLILPIGSSFDIYLRGGGAYYKADSEQRWIPGDGSTPLTNNVSHSELAPILGLGFGMVFNEHWGGRLELQDIQLGDGLLPGNDDKTSLASWTAEVIYRF